MIVGLAKGLPVVGAAVVGSEVEAAVGLSEGFDVDGLLVVCAEVVGSDVESAVGLTEGL